MARIRWFEEVISRAFYAGQLPGGVHLSIGQEGIAAGVGCAMAPGDRSTSTHRGHGDLIAVGADIEKMFAEILGRVTGSCGAKGGSMHIVDNTVGSLGTNGIVGGGIPMAVGSALTSEIQGDGAVTVAFFGDGAVNTGSFHESMNLAAIWKLPIVFVCQNNLFGQFTKTATLFAGESIAARAAAYGVEAAAVDGSNVVEVWQAASAAVDAARRGDGPRFIEGRCYRFRGHTEGDVKYIGGQKYREDEELESYLGRDPLKTVVDLGYLERESAAAITSRVNEEIEAMFERATNDPLPDGADALVKTFAGAPA